MNIKQIIVEEVRLMLLENDLVDSLEQLPEEELVAAIKKLIPLVTSGLPKYIAQEAPVAEGIKGALAKTLINLPGGRDLGAMYLAAIDRATPAAIRVAFLVALANLVSPVDLGTILSGGLLDMLGPLTALDDILLIRKVLQMMKSEGLPSERHHDKLDQLAGSDPRQLEEPANVDGQPEEPLNERKIRKSAIYKIIQEELEVVLTNEEVEEFFDLDGSALLDEMMSEEEDKSFSKAGEEIKEKGTEGVFTAKADKAGMGVQAYAAKVLKKGSEASTKTKRQAAFAKGAATVARENK